MMSDTLYIIVHIPLVDKSPLCNLYRIHNIPLVHTVLKKSLKYSTQEEYLAIRSDTQYILFPLRTDIMACKVSNGKFCHISFPLYTADTSNSCSYALFLQNKDKINKLCTLWVINQTQDEAFNINDNFCASALTHIMQICHDFDVANSPQYHAGFAAMLFQWSHSHMQHFSSQIPDKNRAIKRGLEWKNCTIKKSHYVCQGTNLHPSR